MAISKPRMQDRGGLGHELPAAPCHESIAWLLLTHRLFFGVRACPAGPRWIAYVEAEAEPRRPWPRNEAFGDDPAGWLIDTRARPSPPRSPRTPRPRFVSATAPGAAMRARSPFREPFIEPRSI